MVRIYWSFGGLYHTRFSSESCAYLPLLPKHHTATHCTFQLIWLKLCRKLVIDLPLSSWNCQKLREESYCRQITIGLKCENYWSCNSGKPNTLNEIYYRKCMAGKISKKYFLTFVYFKKYSVERKNMKNKSQKETMYYICSPTRYTMFLYDWVLFITYVSSTCFGPHRSIFRSVLYKLYVQIWYVVLLWVLLDTL